MSSKSPKSKCFDKFDLNESTCKFVKKCDPGKVRNKEFRCVKEKSTVSGRLTQIKDQFDKLNEEGFLTKGDKLKRSQLRSEITKMLKKEGLQDFEMDEIKSVAEHIRQHSANSVEKQNLKAEQTAKKQANKTAQKSMKQQAQNNLIIAKRIRERKELDVENPKPANETLKNRKAAAALLSRKKSRPVSPRIPLGISLNGSSISSVVSVLKNTLNRFSRSNSGSRTPGSRTPGSRSPKSSSSRSSSSLSQATQSK